MNCKPHNDATNHKSAGFDARGCERIVCAKCRRFIGYKPGPTQTPKVKGEK